MTTFVRRVDTAHALKHAGVNVQTALGVQRPVGAHAWLICTPVGSGAAAIESSKFYRSINDHVDDPEKKGHFANLLNALSLACKQANYQDVLKGSNVSVKPAFSFNYSGKGYKVWELKSGKKDRVYFFSCEIGVGGKNLKIIVLLLAYHKKDQTTPADVCSYAERVMRDFICNKPNIEIAKD